MKVGINGFGRMGRLALRAAWGWPELEFVHVNEVKGGPPAAAHLLEFDSVHGRWPVPVAARNGGLHIDGRSVGFSDGARPEEVPWGRLGVELVLECTGKFKTPDALAGYQEQGVHHVVVAAPVKEGALNVVMGVNDESYHPAQNRIVTAASCTTNCLAHVVKPIHETLGIRHGAITTIHDATNTQVVVDAPHKDLRRARSAMTSLIPTTTGSAEAIALIYPELKGKLYGHAVRVPLLNASITDCVFEVGRPTDAEEVNAILKAAAEGPQQGYLGYETRPLVSVDYRSDPRSAIIDAPSTLVIDQTQVKLLAWYDNEMGYAHRLVELARKIALSA